jgi:hypothetical protein
MNHGDLKPGDLKISYTVVKDVGYEKYNHLRRALYTSFVIGSVPFDDHHVQLFYLQDCKVYDQVLEVNRYVNSEYVDVIRDGTVIS